MANDLVSYTALVQDLLEADTTRFPQSTVTAALRQAIDEYSRHVPILYSGVLNTVANQHEYSLSTLTGLILAYDVLDDAEIPISFNQYRQAGITPYIFITPAQPSGHEITIRYTKLHTLKDLDSATTTTIRTDHTNIICAGAVGFALKIRMSSRLEGDNLDPGTLEYYRHLSEQYLVAYYVQLAGMSSEQGVQKEPGSDTRTWEDDYHNFP